jgi:two-component system response regulator HydG
MSMPDAEVLKMITFSPEDGRIWFNHRRVMMLDTESFAALRDSLIRGLGPRGARALLTQVGYRSGMRDAEMLRQEWPTDYRERSSIGTQFHSVAGIARVERVHTDFRPKEGYFSGEFILRHTVEDDVNILTQGLGTEPACWMELGYASGYLSTICDQLIVVREYECRSMGSTVCRVVAKPASEWDDVDEDLFFLGLRGPTPRLRPPPVFRAESPPCDDTDIIGHSAALRAALGLLRKVAPTRATVLITGESGVGKELFARVLHRHSSRADGPFMAVNCAALPEELVESELFGVVRGGFTGAVQSRPGRFERAQGGTLFLDEVGTLSLAAQAKLLRAIQEQEIERVGGSQTIKVDVRIVAATNVNLREAVARGEFREDLYYRLNVFPIHLPPLRERRDDIPALVSHFLRRYGALHGKPAMGVTGRAMQALLNHRYPGNIRELENLIERAVILAEGEHIDLPDLMSGDQALDSQFYRVNSLGQLELGDHAGSAEHAGECWAGQLDAWAEQVLDACAQGHKISLARLEGDLFGALTRAALARSNGNVAAAARLLGVKRHQLEYRLKSRAPAAAPAGPPSA